MSWPPQTALMLLFAASRPELELEWSGLDEAECGREVFERALDEVLGAPNEAGSNASRQAEPTVVAAVALSRVDGKHAIELRGRKGDESIERTLRDPSCEAVLEAAALIVALAIDPALGEVDVEPSPPNPSQEVDVPTPPEAGSSPEPQRSRGMGALLGVDVGAAIWGLPSATGNFGATIGMVLGPARVMARGRYRLPTQARHPNGGGGSFSLGAGEVRACGVLGPARVEVPICGGVELGGVRARGLGLQNEAVSHRLWVAPRLGVGVGYRSSGPVAVGIEADLGIVLVSERYFIEGRGQVFRTAPIELLLRAYVNFVIAGPR